MPMPDAVAHDAAPDDDLSHDVPQTIRTICDMRQRRSIDIFHIYRAFSELHILYILTQTPTFFISLISYI